MARRLAVARSHAPGFWGTPVSGHRSSAVTSASCASSSASDMSRVIRASTAMSRACSIRHTARMARWVSATVTVADYRTGRPGARFAWSRRRRLGQLTHFTLAFPAFSILLVEIHELDGAGERLFPGLEFEDGVAADALLGFRERPVDHIDLPAREPHARAHRQRHQAAHVDHGARLHFPLGELADLLH